MTQIFASRISHWRPAVMIVLGFAAAAGWTTFAVSSHSAAESERQLREQVVDLQAGQLRLLTERDQLQSTTTEITQLRKQLKLAQDEAARLTQEKLSDHPKLSVAQPSLPASSPTTRQPQNVVAQVGSTSSMPPTPPRAPVRAVGSALAKEMSQ